MHASRTIETQFCPACKSDLPLDRFRREHRPVCIECDVIQTASSRIRHCDFCDQDLQVKDFSFAVQPGECDECARSNYMLLLAVQPQWPAWNAEIREMHKIRADDAQARHRRAMWQLASSRRRALIAACEINDFTAMDWSAILAESDGCCHYCEQSCGDLQIEHKTPLSRGGNHTRSNIVAACPSCNYRKHARTDSEFLAVLAAQ